MRSAAEAEGAVFLDSRQFAFVSALESQWEAIRAEYLALPPEQFDPWVQREMHGGGWTVFGLYAIGEPIPGACAACPDTVRALEQVPGLSMAGFSRLAPRTHVEPHVGWAESVYRMHLALVVPTGCRLRVAAETRSWQEGRSLVFDDTVEHEAWNDSELSPDRSRTMCPRRCRSTWHTCSPPVQQSRPKAFEEFVLGSPAVIAATGVGPDDVDVTFECAG